MSGLIFAGSPPRSAIAFRIAARSTTAGTPVRSCSRTRDGENEISFDGSAFASQRGDRVDVRLAAVAQHVLEQHAQRVGQARDVVGGLQLLEPVDLVGAVSDLQLRGRGHCPDSSRRARAAAVPLANSRCGDGAAHRRPRGRGRHGGADAALTTTSLGLTGKPSRGCSTSRPRRRSRRRRSSASTSCSVAGPSSPPVHVSLAAGGPARADPVPGRDLRQRRQHREHAGDLARARLRRAAARGVGERDRPLGRERRDDLLVRGRRHRLVRPAARGSRLPRLPAGQRLPALRRRGAAAAEIPRAGRRRASRRESPPTTASGCTTSAPSCARSSRAARSARPIASRAQGEEKLPARELG